jgi:hypothetical protein
MKPGNMPMDIYRGDTSAWQFRLNEEWAKFWAVAEPFIVQLDNGA